MSLHSHENHRCSRRSWLGAAAAVALSPLLLKAECPCDTEEEIQKKAATTKPNTPGLLGVCADPNNLPFSNRNREGFEDKIAALIASELGVTLKYDWLPQRLGFYRTALKTFDSDVVMAAPAGFEKALITRPYYRSSYVFVRRQDGPNPVSLDDPLLKSVKIGVQLTGGDNTPPTHALAKRNLIDNVKGFTVFDETTGAPGERIIKAVADREIDVAIAWGPQAGYFASRQARALAIKPVTPEADRYGDTLMPFTFEICMAVRRTDTALQDRINNIIAARQNEIDRILDEYQVPRLPLIKPVAAAAKSGTEFGNTSEARK